MGRKSKRLRLKTRIERLNAEASRPSSVVENSVMQERVKKEVPPPIVEEEKVDVAPDTNFTPEVVEEMIEEVKEMVEEIKPKPRSKPRPRRRRTRTKKAE